MSAALGVSAVVLAAVAGDAAAAPRSAPHVIFRGEGAEPVLSSNGHWALISDSDDRLYLWHAGQAVAGFVGTGTRALAVADDGRFAYECTRRTVCLGRAGHPRMRRIALPCNAETLLDLATVSSDLRTMFVACEFPHVIRKITIDSGGTHTTTVLDAPGLLPPAVDAVSADGSTAILETHDGAVETTFYVDRAGVDTRLELTSPEAVSGNGTWVVGTGTEKGVADCLEAPSFQPGVPVELNTLDGARRALPELNSCSESAWAVSDDGATVVGELASPLTDGQRRLELVDLETGAAEALPPPAGPGLVFGAPQLADGTLLYRGAPLIGGPDDVVVEQVTEAG